MPSFFSISAPSISVTALSAEPWTGRLAPGAYQVQYATGVGYGVAPFTVLADGMIACSIAASSFTEWDDRGKVLRLSGLPMLVDATELTAKGAASFGGGMGEPLTTAKSRAVRLLPGRHLIGYSTGVGYGVVVFDVASDGSVDIVDEPSGVRLLQTTPLTLKLDGIQVVVDSQQLTPPRQISFGGGIGEPFSTGESRAVRLLPGRHSVGYSTGVGYGVVVFDVNVNGAVSVVDEPRGATWVESSRTLSLEGVEVIVDAATLSTCQLGLGGGVSAAFPNSKPNATRLLPGRHSVAYATGVGYGAVVFDMHADGTITVFDEPKGVQWLSAARTLRLQGVDVTVNAVALASCQLSFGGGIGEVFESGATVTRAPATWTSFGRLRDGSWLGRHRL